jgi:predicted metal-dependent hydrolase
MSIGRKLDAEIAAHRAREQLRARIQRLINKWGPRLGVHPKEWDIKSMKTYWASTDSANCRLTFNLKLAEMSPAFLEVTVVHELVHCLTDGHDRRFYELMDRHVPNWRRLHEKYAEPLTLNS